MALVGTYISMDWKLKKILLDFKYLPGSHTGLNIANEFILTLDKLNLKEKVRKIIH